MLWIMPPRTKWDSSPILVFQNENVLTVLKSFFCFVEKNTPRNFKKKKKKNRGERKIQTYLGSEMSAWNSNYDWHVLAIIFSYISFV